jgi:hypothetical protein
VRFSDWPLQVCLSFNIVSFLVFLVKLLSTFIPCYTSSYDPLDLIDRTSFFFWWLGNPMQAMASSFLRFLYHTRRRTKVSRSPLDELSACRRDPLPDNTQHSQQTSMPPAGFKSTFSAGSPHLTPHSHWDWPNYIRCRNYNNAAVIFSISVLLFFSYIETIQFGTLLVQCQSVNSDTSKTMTRAGAHSTPEHSCWTNGIRALLTVRI